MRIQVVRRICISLGLSSWILCTLPLLTRKAPNELQVGKHFQQWIFLHVLIEPKKALGHAAWTPWKHFLVTFSNNYKNCWEPGSIANQSCHVLQDIVGISWHEWQSLRSSICPLEAGGRAGAEPGNLRKSQGTEPLKKLRFGDPIRYPNLECWIRLGTVGCNCCFHQMTRFQIPALHVRATLLHMFQLCLQFPNYHVVMIPDIGGKLLANIAVPFAAALPHGSQSLRKHTITRQSSAQGFQQRPEEEAGTWDKGFNAGWLPDPVLLSRSCQFWDEGYLICILES